MRVQVLQHVSFEDIGCMHRILQERNAEIDYTRFFEDSTLPEASHRDLVIVMGGPMSVNDDGYYPWIITELEFIRECIETRTPIIGICLGAQLIAKACGARVYPGTEKEIGFFPVESTPQDEYASLFPKRFSPLHWHGETFDLPENTLHLASSAICRNQAFAISDHAIGLQFHLETTRESLDAIITHCRDEIVEADYIQSCEEMRAISDDDLSHLNTIMANTLDFLLN